MKRERPASVLVIAILAFIYGGLGILCNLCFVPFGILIHSNFSDPQLNQTLEVYRAIPGMGIYLIITGLISMAMSAVLIITGVGMLKLQSWARWAAIGCAGYSILAWLIDLVRKLAVNEPAVKRYLEARGLSANMTLSSAMDVGLALCGMAIPVAILIVMFLPNVSAAFAGQPMSRPQDMDDHWGA